MRRSAGRIWVVRSAVVAALLMLFAGHPASAACRVEPRATIPVQRVGGAILVPVAVNGITADFVLDTGAERSVVGLQAATRLALARDEWVSTDMLGTGGFDRRRLGRPRSLMLGGIALRRHTVAADNSLVVGPIMETIAGHPVAGLLGEDFLSPFDLDLDVAAGTLKLFDVTGCSGAFVPWPGHVTAIAAMRPVRNILVLPVAVAGRALEAQLDTGASASVIMAPGMAKLGLLPGGGEPLRGFGNGIQHAHAQSFSLQVGSTPAAATTLLVAPIHGLRSIDMLLGADWVGVRRIWISWATNQVFLPAAE
jgi:Aspartyl protease